MSITITKRLEIDAGHRLLGHEGKCRSCHGHRYAFEFTIESPGLDDLGRVVDFGVIKQIVGGWLDEHLDHAFIGQDTDPLTRFLIDAEHKVYVVNFPPTAEHLAEHLHTIATRHLPKTLRVVAVRCQETPSSVAEFRP